MAKAVEMDITFHVPGYENVECEIIKEDYDGNGSPLIRYKRGRRTLKAVIPRSRLIALYGKEGEEGVCYFVSPHFEIETAVGVVGNATESGLISVTEVEDYDQLLVNPDYAEFLAQDTSEKKAKKKDKPEKKKKKPDWVDEDDE